MRRRTLGTALALAVLLPSLLSCSSSDEVVASGAPPQPHPTPTPKVPTDVAALRYVSPSGNDRNPGTLNRPWRTLGNALHRIYIGQVLFVRGGEYHENIDHIRLHAGSAGRPITVLAYPGESPVLVGSVSLRRPAYWLIDNIDVTGDPTEQPAPSFMVKVIGGHNWTWQNSEFTNTTGRANVMITGWGVGEPRGFKFRGNCLHDLPRPPMGSTNLFLGSMQPDAHGTVSRNVVFNDQDQPNVRIGSGAGAPVRVRVLQNTIYGGSLGIDVRGHPRRVKISRNIVGGSTAPAMIRFHRGKPRGTTVTNNVAVNAAQLLRPEVRKNVHGFGNVVLSGHPDFVDTTRCDGFRSGLDAMIPYGAFAP
jgi:hypothetical protein